MIDNEPQHILRIRQELCLLQEKGNIETELILECGTYVLYKGLKTGGLNRGLPVSTDVLVPVPPGYPGAAIDMPAIPNDSALTPHLVGGNNPQYVITTKDGMQWRVLSYHPYANGGGPPWDPMKHGFHDYYNHLFTWLHNII